MLLVSQGVLQTLGGTVAGLARGPVASQEAIKELGTNGGGFFNVNSAYPFENATGLSNLIEIFLILCIPASLTYTYGRMVGSRRQGWAIFAAMSTLFIASVVVVYLAELHGTPAQHAAGIHTGAIDGSTGGNMEGKDVRFGIANSTLWAAVTTVTSCGAVNAAFESLTGIGGLVPMVDLGYGESVFGGVGTGLYTMLLYVLLAVFIGGLMVGRTPEFLGKKVEAREIKLVVARGARHAAGRPARHRRGAGAPSTASRRSSPPGPRASASRCTPTCRRPTTTARRSPATPATTSPTPATSAPTASPSPTCSAA